MHELSLAHEVVRVLCEEADKHAIQRIDRFKLEVGLLRAVVPDMLQSCLGFVSRGTAAEEAAVEMVEVPGRVRCLACAEEFGVPDLLIICPRCGQVGGDILAGQELRLVELEGE
jgi:hydrogenase nickel incorporation protein HypA/HybF